ncbi:MAG: GFA family protein [Proteobacteria bacterium]|nr:GFA family protein [Pseudomonadota bacterium]
MSATGHAALMGFSADELRIRGDAKEYRSKADSGSDVSRAFCPNCGSGVFARVSAMPGMIFVRASTLDDPSIFVPQLTVYASRAPAWDPVSPDIPAFDERPPPS